MELIIIGSGTGVIQAHRGTPGHVLLLNNEIFLIDGGSGTLRKCMEVNISYKEIDKLFYTHLHPDHTIDLVPFLFATKHTPGFVRTKRLDIFGPLGFQDFFDKLTGLYSTGVTEVEYEIVLHELSQQSMHFDGWSLQTNLMNHTPNAIGYRFNCDSKSFVFSGDTDFCEEIIELARDADVMLLECSFPDSMKVKGHLTPSEAGEIASEARVKKLILTHLYPPCDEVDIVTPCAKHFSGEIIIARDLMRVQI